MSIQKYDIEAYRKKRRKKYQVEIFKAELGKNKTSLVPVGKPLSKYKQNALDLIVKFVKTDRFWKIFSAFSTVRNFYPNNPGCGKAIKFTKNFKTTALIVKYFLQGKLYIHGFPNWESNHRVRPNLPDNFKEMEIDYSMKGLLTYIERFNLVRNDKNYLPKNKNYVQKASLAQFIFGSTTPFSQAKPILLQYCLTEPKTVFQDPDEKATQLLKEIHHKYLNSNDIFTHQDNKNLSLVADKIIRFAEANNISTVKFMEEFFKSLGNWRFSGTAFLTTSKMWERFLNHLQKMGYSLKPEVKIVKEKAKVIKPETPKQRRKKLLKSKKAETKELKKKIHKPMNIKRK